MPVGSRLRAYKNFVLSFDCRLRNPSWVLEHISQQGMKQREASRLHSSFREDDAIEPRFRSKLADYKVHRLAAAPTAPQQLAGRRRSCCRALAIALGPCLQYNLAHTPAAGLLV